MWCSVFPSNAAVQGYVVFTLALVQRCTSVDHAAQVGGPLHPPLKIPIPSAFEPAPPKALNQSDSATAHGCGEHRWRGGLVLGLLGQASKWAWACWAGTQWVRESAAHLIRHLAWWEERPAAWEAGLVSAQSRRLHFEGALRVQAFVDKLGTRMPYTTWYSGWSH